MIDLTTLNPPQREAVTQIDGPILILAGAGTGKTRVISVRIAHMVDCGIPPDSIVALSFTNKAAREMAERVRALTSKVVASDLWLGTFHSFCLHILREFSDAAGLDRRFSLAGTSDQIDLVRKAIEEKNWKAICNVEELHGQISKAKNQLMSPQEVKERGRIELAATDAETLGEVYSLYERQLQLHRMIDFDDCIYKTVRLLREHPHILAKLRARFKYLMVDEFQDTNFAQLTIIELLGSEHQNVCVVGDDDQSIYSWRGAMYETFQHFEDLFKGTKLIKLEQNYRCTNVILGAANQVIKNNTKRKDKALWSTSLDQTLIHVATLENEQIEAKWIAEKCLSLLGQGFKLKDIGVLFRAGMQARPIEMMMRECRLTTKTFGGQSFFERKEVKDFMAYLRLAVRPDDRLAFWRAVNTPTRGIGLRTLEKLEDLAKKTGLSPYKVIKENPLTEFGRVKENLQQFVELIDGIANHDLLSPEGFEDLGRAIIKNAKLLEDIRINSDNPASRDRKTENLVSLPAWLKKAAVDLIEEAGELDPVDLVDRLTLESPASADERGDKGNYISLMTIHSAKGLEFPAVFLCGVEEDLLPHKNSVNERNGLAEERRLFYVALTRAKTKLFLTNTVERSQGGRTTDRKPSRFLAEIPAEHLTTLSDLALAEAQQARTETRRAETKGQLSKIRESLQSGKW